MRNEKPKLQGLHPNLDSLLTAQERFAVAADSWESTSSWVVRQAHELVPAKWTDRIEAAIGKADELYGLRVQYDELALTYMSSSIRAARQYSVFSHACDAFRMAIEQTIVFLDSFEANGPDRWLKCILQGACLIAVKKLSSVNQWDHRQTRGEELPARAEKIMREAYRKLVAELKPEVPVSCCYAANYTTDLVVNGSKFRLINTGLDLRTIFCVDLEDREKSASPANSELARLLQALDKAQDEARDASSWFTSQRNGGVGESQHATALLDALHCTDRGGLTTQTIEAQNDRRANYEYERRVMDGAVERLRQAHAAVVVALRPAVVEATFLVDLTERPSASSVDYSQYGTARAVMNNCLAADYMLRSIGREIKVLQNVADHDLSENHGREALAQAYAEVERVFRPRPMTEQHVDF